MLHDQSIGVQCREWLWSDATQGLELQPIGEDVCDHRSTPIEVSGSVVQDSLSLSAQRIAAEPRAALAVTSSQIELPALLVGCSGLLDRMTRISGASALSRDSSFAPTSLGLQRRLRLGLALRLHDGLGMKTLGNSAHPAPRFHSSKVSGEILPLTTTRQTSGAVLCS